jgi:hypothetical protein
MARPAHPDLPARQGREHFGVNADSLSNQGTAIAILAGRRAAPCRLVPRRGSARDAFPLPPRRRARQRSLDPQACARRLRQAAQTRSVQVKSPSASVTVQRVVARLSLS